MSRGQKIKRAIRDRARRTADLRRALAAKRRDAVRLLKLYRHLHKAHKDAGAERAALAAYRRTRAQAARLAGETAHSARKGRTWRRTLAALRVKLAEARKHPYPHLRGDLTSNTNVLRALECMGKQHGVIIYVTSGMRSMATAQRLWNARASNPYPVAVPCRSNHCGGNAADALVNGTPIYYALGYNAIKACGLLAYGAGDAVHVSTNGR